MSLAICGCVYNWGAPALHALPRPPCDDGDEFNNQVGGMAPSFSQRFASSIPKATTLRSWCVLKLYCIKELMMTRTRVEPPITITFYTVRWLADLAHPIRISCK